MDLTFRLPGPWGAGKGANLQPTEVDNNFWELAEAIVDLQSNPAQPVGIASISVSGTQMTIMLTDGSTMGPFTLPVLTFRWRGEWVPGAVYAELDVFSVLNVGIFMALLDHTSGATFDPDIAVAGEPALQQLFGSADASLSSLPDVNLTTLQVDDFLTWDGTFWVNVALGTIVYQDADDVAITGGAITGMPAPVNPSDVATKAYVDALPGGATADPLTLMSNITDAPAPAIPNTLTDYLDAVLGAPARGTMLYRGGAGWLPLVPGTAGYFLQTHDAGADPTWAAGGSGVTSITAGTGISTGAGPITATGTVALASIGDDTFLANISGVSAAPTPTTLTTWLDSVLGTARGTVITRAVGGWVSLSPGLVGQYLKSAGSGADLTWDSPPGSGTLTSITAGTGISTGGAPITSTGSVSLAAIATNSVLANTSGGSAAPVPMTVSLLFDATLGSAQGSILYRNASTWVVLTPGTSGQILTTAGAAANPSWANAPITGAAIAHQRIVSNISGVTAAAAANTLSNILDNILGSSRGMVIYRGSGAWAALAAGTSGQFLRTGGTGADPSWATPAGGGGSSGDVVGPASAVDDSIATFDGTTGKLVQDGGATIADLKREAIQVAASDETTAITTGTAKLTFRMPFGMTLTEVRASLSTAGSTLTTVDINEGGTSILSTKLTIDASERTSTTAAAAAVISDTALADDAEITIDIDGAGTGAKGLKITLLGTRA